MKKVVIFGGGSGLSQLLKGLIQFPLDLTAVVSVSDNGGSTGRLREEFAIPAVGDITKVLTAMSTESKGVKDLFNYRFSSDSSIGNHSIKNLIITALLEMHGDFAHSLPILCDLLDVKGKILPLTEDNVDLIGVTKEGYEIIGEAEITESKREIVDLKYNKKVTVTPKVIEEIKKQYGENPFANSDYGKIINDKHFDRLQKLICKEKLVYGGKVNKQTLQIEPTVLDNVLWTDNVMQEEIFGPIMPILTFDDINEVIAATFQRIQSDSAVRACFFVYLRLIQIERIVIYTAFDRCIERNCRHLKHPCLFDQTINHRPQFPEISRKAFREFTENIV